MGWGAHYKEGIDLTNHSASGSASILEPECDGTEGFEGG